MRTIGVVSVGRSDYGIYWPLLKAIQRERDLRLHLLVAGQHLLPKFGKTVDEIQEEGFPIGDAIPIALENDGPEGIAASTGNAVQAFAKSYSKLRPDLLVVLGDRFEMHAAALAALPFKIPAAHIHGGELTLGAIDDSLRHGITKMAHLHFPATEIYGRRIRQLGEEDWRITVAGAPALDAIDRKNVLSLEGLNEKYSLRLKSKPILVTYHPVTLEFEKTGYQMNQLLAALQTLPFPIVFTGVNADTHNGIIREKIGAFVSARPESFSVPNFGPRHYFDMLANAEAMVGNSSSGLIEAPSFELPVVNIGRRQEGRVRAENVIDVGYAHEEISGGIAKALSEKFHASLKGMKNPYGDGRASSRIVEKLKQVPLDERLILKRFVDRIPA